MASSLVGELRGRGLVAQVSDEPGLVAHLGAAPRTLYCGFDATADSLHHAHLLQIVALRRFQLAGHRPIALVGGATGLIGDPSFKSDERVLLGREEVARNSQAIRRQIERYIDFEQSPTAAQGALLVNNLDWTEKLDVVTFLRDVCKYFSVNDMMRKDSVRSRLEREGAGLSFTEFSYQILQANDYLELARRHGCTLQIGGNDQWGNITAGMELVRRALGREAFALTSPLITKSDGTKFGKTESGTIWLAPHRTSPYAFYQFWINTADVDVAPFLRYFTFLPLEHIDALAEATREDPQRREGQQRLAQEVTRLVHGEHGLRAAEGITRALFSGNIAQLSGEDLRQLELDGLPAMQAAAETTRVGEALTKLGLAPSNQAAMQLIRSGAVTANGIGVSEVGAEVREFRPVAEGYVLLRRGRRAWGIVHLESGRALARHQPAPQTAKSRTMWEEEIIAALHELDADMIRRTFRNLFGVKRGAGMADWVTTHRESIVCLTDIHDVKRSRSDVIREGWGSALADALREEKIIAALRELEVEMIRRAFKNLLGNRGGRIADWVTTHRESIVDLTDIPGVGDDCSKVIQEGWDSALAA